MYASGVMFETHLMKNKETCSQLMKNKCKSPQTRPLSLALAALSAQVVFIAQAQERPIAPAATPGESLASPPIICSEIGARAGADYNGDGLSVVPTESGARLRCVFQRLEGEATSEGLWLRSTVTNTRSERFRVMACSVGRWAEGMNALPRTGTVNSDSRTESFIRPGLIEEYTVNMDGVRQDFIIEKRPEGGGEMRVEFSVTGAKAEPLRNGAQLVLNGSGRNIAYSRLRVSDATRRELSARMEVTGKSKMRNMQNSKFETGLAVVVEDSDAVYPIRIDPTFSDANWVSMGGVPGANGTVNVIAADGAGSLYIGGNFTTVGDVIATNIAKWNGSSWSALGSGMD